ncbi:uncharacterized protein morgue isoform X2 [Hetaerina americana]|uniref:uncharacterized protein morgue isoform X2 n=1 Tax=Hetaerina americana TaxID=62018 RepID=UPI003A7F5C90
MCLQLADLFMNAVIHQRELEMPCSPFGEASASAENSDRRPVNTEDTHEENELNNFEEFTENFNYEYVTCYMCNGYYGPCFDEPVCATCHAFIFPSDFFHPEVLAFFSEKTDDEDSGNDEPSDPTYYGSERRQSSAARGSSPAMPSLGPPPYAAVPPNNNNNVNPAPVVDRLVERLQMLSVPRQMPDDLSPGLVECLPPEVLLAVFSYLDDLSLWSVAHVCRRWRRLVLRHVSGEQWKRHTTTRWPLFSPLVHVPLDCWAAVHSNLIDSAPCKVCLQQMALRSHPPGEENSWRRNRLRNELKSLRTDPPEGIRATPLDRECCHWQATITGPTGSPYEGGIFYLYLQVPYSYPMFPPVVRFVTRIFHPNVSRHGDVGIDSIHHNWSLALTLSKVLISVQSLLTDPYTEVCMEPRVGDLYNQDRKTFEDVARAWTWRYAMHDVLLPITEGPPYSDKEEKN